MFYDITRFLVVGELRFVDWNWGSLVDRGWGVDWSSLHNNRSRLVDWGWGWFVDWGRGWGIDWGWLVDWSSLNHDWSSLVDRGGLDNNRGWLVGRSWGIGDWGWLVSWGCVISSLSRVGDISDVSTVTISDIVSHSLCASIRQGNTVASLGTVSISRLVSIVVGSTVAIIDSVVVAVDSGFTVVRLDIGRSSVS